ncbi:MAG: hypothetical protein JST38_13770, partial [Bacteroidetes bacterium]|nr:hypothetical protein [Bacteroidota bacterium]
RTWEWNYAESPPFTVERQGFVDGVEVSVKVTVEKGLVKEVKHGGTSFATQRLEHVLDHVPYRLGDLRAALQGSGLRTPIGQLLRLYY